MHMLEGGDLIMSTASDAIWRARLEAEKQQHEITKDTLDYEWEKMHWIKQSIKGYFDKFEDEYDDSPVAGVMVLVREAEAGAQMHEEARLLAVKYWEAIQAAPHSDLCKAANGWPGDECDCWKSEIV